MSPLGRMWVRTLAGMGLLALLAAALVAWLNLRDESPVMPGRVVSTDAALIARGAYLARAGNCIGCHTARGGADYAGGREVPTPFGNLYTTNLTPDEATGLGRWSPSEFWRAMHNGRSRDGRLLYPAFPYPNFTLVTRDDSDALYAFFQSLPPVSRPATPHALRFPYDQQASLAVWRALFFRPGSFAPELTQIAAWNRGAYLVRGLGHCVACHAGRNALGATTGDLALDGGLIPMQNWYAPSLGSAREAGVADWAPAEIVALLKTGVTERASVMGPMAEVVFRSTQHLRDDDLHAMATYLQTLPQAEPPPVKGEAATPEILRTGAALYARHCASCHGPQGQGVPGRYPALAGNRAVTLPAPVNLVKTILHGGFAPSTAGNPRPFGMPPFQQVLNDTEVAALATYLRNTWSHQASTVTAQEAARAR